MGLLIRMSAQDRETVHALARAAGVTTRAYVLGLVKDDLARKRRQEIARRRAGGDDE